MTREEQLINWLVSDGLRNKRARAAFVVLLEKLGRNDLAEYAEGQARDQYDPLSNQDKFLQVLIDLRTETDVGVAQKEILGELQAREKGKSLPCDDDDDVGEEEEEEEEEES